MRELARLAAAAVAAFVVLRNVAVAGSSGTMTGASVIVGIVVVIALASRSDGMVTGSGVVLAGHYLVALWYGTVELDLAAPVIGALIVVYLDLADLAAALPGDRRVDRAFLRTTLRRAGGVFGLASLAGMAAFGLASLPWPAHEALRAAGALGVAAVAAVPLILLRRSQ